MTERLSYSQLSGWTGCGERYRLERIVRVPQVPAWNLIGGSAAHEVTEQHDLSRLGVALTKRNETFEEAFERLTVDAEEESGIDRSGFRASGRASKQWPDKENADWWLENGPAMVRRWDNFIEMCPWDIWITPDEKPAIELGFNLPLLPDDNGNNRVEVRGFIDRVFVDHRTGELIVVDLKTGASKQPTPRQLGVYRVGLRDRYGVDARLGTFWDARSGTTSEVHALTEYTPERIAWQFGTLAKARLDGVYLPNPGPLCGSCSVNQYCFEYTPDATARVRPPWVSADEWELTA